MANAAERLRQRTFEVRDKSVKQPVVYAGTLIKVGTRGGRFWCRVKWVRWDGALVVTVDNDLIKLPWKCGDEIVVQQEHVLETCDPTDMTFAGLLAASRAVIILADLLETNDVNDAVRAIEWLDTEATSPPVLIM